MKESILKALRLKYEGQIAEAKANIDIYLSNPVGIGEQPEVLEAIDTQVNKIAEAEDRLMVLDGHFTTPKIP